MKFLRTFKVILHIIYKHSEIFLLHLPLPLSFKQTVFNFSPQLSLLLANHDWFVQTVKSHFICIRLPQFRMAEQRTVAARGGRDEQVEVRAWFQSNPVVVRKSVLTISSVAKLFSKPQLLCHNAYEGIAKGDGTLFAQLQIDQHAVLLEVSRPYLY